MSKITKTILIILISILFIFTTKCFAIDLNLPKLNFYEKYL